MHILLIVEGGELTGEETFNSNRVHGLNGAESLYFGLFWPHSKLPPKIKEPVEYNSIATQKNRKVIIIIIH